MIIGHRANTQTANSSRSIFNGKALAVEFFRIVVLFVLQFRYSACGIGDAFKHEHPRRIERRRPCAEVCIGICS